MFPSILTLLAATTLVTAGCNMRPRPFPWVVGSDGCQYQDSTYAHGSTNCQAGTQFRCDDGQWKGRGSACTENPAPLAKRCELGSDSYSSGSASCQLGTQHRCDDGHWRNLALDCAGENEPPERVVPDRNTCLYNDATVASESTICKTGVTFRCDDGEWRNLGLACR